MKRRFLVLPACLALIAPGVARADDLPEPRKEYYSIHISPTDPTSVLKWTIALTLVPQSRDGNSVAWLVDVFTISKIGSGGSVLASWSKVRPNVETGNGYWTIDHANGMSPTEAEFAVPPLIFDIATADQPGNAALDFAWQGQVYTPPPGGPPWNGHVGAVDYQFTRVGDPVPEDEGDDEPVETDEPPDSPG